MGAINFGELPDLQPEAMPVCKMPMGYLNTDPRIIGRSRDNVVRP